MGHADHMRLAAAVQEELLDGVAGRAVAVDAAILPLEVGRAEDMYGLVLQSLREVADEGRDGRGDAGDSAHAARDFLDIDARIGRLDRHGPGLLKREPTAEATREPAGATARRSEERRVGKECVSTWRSRGWP